MIKPALKFKFSKNRPWLSSQLNEVSGIYCIVKKSKKNIIGIYVGSSVNLSRRFYEHWNYYKNKDAKEHSTLTKSYKYKGSYYFYVLKFCKTTKLKYYEQHYIDKLLSKNYRLYNASLNAYGGTKQSKERNKKISISRKGIVFSKQHRKNLSIANTGKVLSSATKEKMSQALTGRTITWGDKIAKAKSIPIRRNDGKMYSSKKEAAIDINCHPTKIHRALENKRPILYKGIYYEYFYIK